MVSDVFQNTAKPPLGLPPLGEVLAVAGVKQAMVLLSDNRSSSLAIKWSTKFPEEKSHHIFLTVVSL